MRKALTAIALVALLGLATVAAGAALQPFKNLFIWEAMSVMRGSDIPPPGYRPTPLATLGQQLVRLGQAMQNPNTKLGELTELVQACGVDLRICDTNKGASHDRTLLLCIVWCAGGLYVGYALGSLRTAKSYTCEDPTPSRTALQGTSTP
ncbi:hypothetical protein ACPA9J_10115 [Pseudomonas aeruginosa]